MSLDWGAGGCVAGSCASECLPTLMEDCCPDRGIWYKQGGLTSLACAVVVHKVLKLGREVVAVISVLVRSMLNLTNSGSEMELYSQW